MYRYLVNFSFWSLNYISTLVQKKNFDKITTTRKGGLVGNYAIFWYKIPSRFLHISI